MARLISYPILSTVASGDLLPITDISDTVKPLKNVAAGTLSTFFNENGVWAPITGGINYAGGNVGIGTTTPAGYLAIQKTNVANDESRGLDIDINKENTSGAGFASNVYGIKSYAKANSTEAVANIGGTWSKAEHLGSGQVYYITGGTNRAYHTGSGNTTTISGIFSEGKVGGTGTGAHTYLVGANNKAVLDNANATAQYMQGMHCTVDLRGGEVTDNMTCLLLDADYTAGTIAGDFEYLSIMSDTLPTVGGTARAINSQSTLPSEFAGDIEISLGKGVILSSPNGTKYKIIVADDGTLSTTAV